MMSFELAQEARVLIERVLGLLCEARLREVVDAPIDRAVDRFLASIPESDDPRRIHSLLAGAVAEIHRSAIQPPSRPGSDRDLAEAIHLLTTVSADGIEGCVLDACDPDIGIDGVLRRLGEAMKAQQKQQIRSRVYWECLDDINWPLRCAVAGQLLSRREIALRHPPSTIDPREAAHALQDLFDLELAVEDSLETLAGPLNIQPSVRGAPPRRLDFPPLRCS